MRQGGGREKGANFERLVATAIRKSLGGKTRDCYRTPMSGGHHSAANGDLVVSLDFVKYFPFAVECKHHRLWTPRRFFSLTRNEASWLDQAETARTETCAPMLIARGHHTPIYAAYQVDDDPGLEWESKPHLIFWYQEKKYVCMLLESLLENLVARKNNLETVK